MAARFRRLSSIAAAALAAAAAVVIAVRAAGPEPPPPPPPAQALDWCARVAVRPDARSKLVGARCIPAWSELEIASGAEVVLLGSESDVDRPNAVTRPGWQCRAAETHVQNRRYIDRLRARRAEQGGAPQRFVHMHRFDLVTDTLAAEPGFRADFLVRTDRPWSEVEAFFANDRSPACGTEGCRFTHAWGGREDEGRGGWIADAISRTGGRPEEIVYYLVRAAQVQQRFWPMAALADQRRPDYRAWRVALAKRAIEVGGYDAIMLNHKFHQFREPHWIGGPMAPDAAALRAIGDDTLWTAPPRDYDGAAYLAGWLALARDLRAAGVPYAVQPPAWPATLAPLGAQGDARTAAAMREALRGARLVLLDRGDFGDRAGLLAFAAELQAAGVEVVWVDTRCGLKRP